VRLRARPHPSKVLFELRSLEPASQGISGTRGPGRFRSRMPQNSWSSINWPNRGVRDANGPIRVLDAASARGLIPMVHSRTAQQEDRPAPRSSLSPLSLNHNPPAQVKSRATAFRAATWHQHGWWRKDRDTGTRPSRWTNTLATFPKRNNRTGAIGTLYVKHTRHWTQIASRNVIRTVSATHIELPATTGS